MYNIFKIKLKYLILILIFIFILIGLLLYSITEPLYTPTAIVAGYNHYNFPKVIDYKCLTSNDVPGNSFSAIQQSLSSTVDGIKVDVRLSKDGILFLYHGDNLQKYTDRQGVPESYNWSDLAQVKYKNTEEKLLLLDDFLDVVGHQKTIFLHIKNNKKIGCRIARSVVNCIKKHKLQDHVFVESFNPFILGAIRMYDRDIMLMYDFVDNFIASSKECHEELNKIPWLLKQHWVQKQIRRIIRPDILGPRFNINPDVLQSLMRNHYPIISWIVNDVNTAKSLYESGIKGLQSSKPQIIEKAIPRKNKKMLDAGGTAVTVHEIIKILDISDIQENIKKAKQQGKKINIGGRRHSMGGQTLSDKGIFFDMLSFNKVMYNPDKKTVTVQAGATWKKIQEILAMHGRSVKVMQSDNIFTVGGSICVNVHGWQVGAPPIASTILNMTVVTSDGCIHKISSFVNHELFRAVTGGYGMFAVIADVELETVPNSTVKFHTFFTKIKNFEHAFHENINKNNKVELAYARLSVDQNNFLDEVGLFWFETQKLYTEKRDIKPERYVALKRGIFRLSEYHNFGKKLRWQAEKAYTTMLANNGELLSRCDAMNTDIHVLWSLYGNSKDILHEYFIPKNKVYNFVKEFKRAVLTHQMNLLNVTIRTVKKDDISLLPYAKEEVYGLVCLFSQKQTPQDEEKMKNFTQAVINQVINIGGSFYLPYRLHYTAAQILQAYPGIKQWIVLKKKYDPELIFESQFYTYIKTLVLKSAY